MVSSFVVNKEIIKYLVIMKDDFNVLFGENIRYFRKLSKLTQEQLAEKLGCAPNTLGYIENGKNLISFSKFRKLCEILEVEPYQFFIFDKSAPDVDRIHEITKLLECMSDKQLGIIYKMLWNFAQLRAEDFKRFTP